MHLGFGATSHTTGQKKLGRKVGKVGFKDLENMSVFRFLLDLKGRHILKIILFVVTASKF